MYIILKYKTGREKFKKLQNDGQSISRYWSETWVYKAKQAEGTVTRGEILEYALRGRVAIRENKTKFLHHLMTQNRLCLLYTSRCV